MLLSIDELKNLVQQPQGLCVSIYMPTYSRGVEIQQNLIRFKNLIRQAEELLQELHSDVELGDEDLLNSAAIQTILNGGTVFAVKPDEVPDAAPIAGVFRY